MTGSDRKIERSVSHDTALNAMLHRRADIETQMHHDGITLFVLGRSLIPGRRRRRRLELDETDRMVWEAADEKPPVRQMLRRVPTDRKFDSAPPSPDSLRSPPTA